VREVLVFVLGVAEMILKTRDGDIEIVWSRARVLLTVNGVHVALSTDEAAAFHAGLGENLYCAKEHADAFQRGARREP
jgi:hypothetical protein